MAGLTESGREVSVTAERRSNPRAHTRSPGGSASSVQGADLAYKRGGRGRRAQGQGWEDRAAWQWRGSPGWAQPWIPLKSD